MNVITIAGNIATKFEVRYTKSEEPKAVGNFLLACDQGNDKEAIFFNCSIFGNRANTLAEYMKVGQAITISGTLMYNKYIDRKGIERESFTVRVGNVALQGGRKEGSEKPQERSTRAESIDDVPF